ncbi:hypothetical protein KC734_08905 [candidate division KSB1 bacterium]|nr:hypothetical protein [candidate division KSB1 bacterium]
MANHEGRNSLQSMDAARLPGRNGADQRFGREHNRTHGLDDLAAIFHDIRKFEQNPSARKEKSAGRSPALAVEKNWHHANNATLFDLFNPSCDLLM